jgi:hypothetical protein
VPDEALQRKKPRVWERGSEVHLSIPCLKPGSIAGWGEGLGWAGRGAHHPALAPLNVSRPLRFLRQFRQLREKPRGGTGTRFICRFRSLRRCGNNRGNNAGATRSLPRNVWRGGFLNDRTNLVPEGLAGGRAYARSGPFERTSWNRLARHGVLLDIVWRRDRRENSCVSIRSSSFVEVCQGSADRGGAARPVPQRREAGVDDRRLHGRDAASCLFSHSKQTPAAAVAAGMVAAGDMVAAADMVADTVAEGTVALAGTAAE